MQWWNEFVVWFNSSDGQDVLVNAVVPFFAILVAGIVAAAIGRGSTKRLLTLNDRENRVAAVSTLIGAARRASVWNTLSGPEQQHADHVASEADVRVRLLSVPGSGMAADWSSHEIASMKKNSVSFSFQAEQSLIEFRDRIVTWQARPSRAKRLFKNDLELWAYEDTQAKTDIVSQQQAWAAAQVTAPPVASPAAPLVAPFAAASVAPAAAPSAAPPREPQPTATVTAPAPIPVSAPAPAPVPVPVPVQDTDTDTDTDTADSAGPPAPLPATGTPELVHPPRPIGSRDDEPTAESDRRLDEAIHATPVPASSAPRGATPPAVGGDSN